MSDVEYDCRVSWMGALLHYQSLKDPFYEGWFWVRRAEIWLIHELLG